MAENATKEKKAAPKKAPKDCACGCGEQTGGGTYRPGHDSRHVSQVAQAALQVPANQREGLIKRLPSEHLQAKARSKVELEVQREADKKAKAEKKAKEEAAA